MATLMQQTSGGWSLYDGNGNLVLTIKNGDAFINGLSSGIKSTLVEHEDRITNVESQLCLRYDTQILMADGSTKNIADVKYGDRVIGWDVDNNCTFEVKSYGAIKTGRAKDWKYFVFEDGKTLEIFNSHGIYSKTHGEIKDSNSWGYGDLGITDKGEEVAFCFKQDIQETHYEDRYVLVTENDTYFANGILCGMCPQTKMRYYDMNLSYFNENITEEDLAFFRITADIFEERKTNKVKHRSFFKEMGGVYAEINRAKRKIKEYKAQLGTVDYKTIKYVQNKLSEEDFVELCAQTQGIRDAIAEQEAIVAELDAIIKAKKDEYGIDKESVKWKALYDINMAYIKANRK